MRDTNKEGHAIWRGALILTVSAFLVKIMSAAYRLPYQNLAGDVGFYAYQQVYPFYAIAVTLGGTGFPIVISKFIAEAKNGGGYRQEAQIRRHALIALFILCGLFFCLLFLFAVPLTKVMGDVRLSSLVRIAAFIYLFVPLIAVLRGNFQGENENMMPTALSQIGEQALRVLLIIGSSWYLFLHHGNPYQFGRAATIGSVAAPAASLIILSFYFRKEKSPFVRTAKGAPGRIDWHLVKDLLISGCLFSLLALPLVSFQLIDSLTVIPLLNHAHVPDPRTENGIYDRAYALTQFGIIAAASLTATIVPGLAKLSALRQKREVQRQASLALKISLAFGLAAAAGLAVIGREVNIMLFKNAAGTVSFSLGAFTMLTLSLILASSGILEATGRPWLPFLYLAAGGAAKLAGNYLLIPLFSINGAAAATCLATALTAWLNIRCLRRRSLAEALRFRLILKLCVAASGMVVAVLFWKRLIAIWESRLADSRLFATGVALSGALVGACVFLILILILRYFDSGDFERLPLIGRRLHKKDLSEKSKISE